MKRHEGGKCVSRCESRDAFYRRRKARAIRDFGRFVAALSSVQGVKPGKRYSRFIDGDLRRTDSRSVRYYTIRAPEGAHNETRRQRRALGKVNYPFVGRYGCGLKTDLAMARDYFVRVLLRHRSLRPMGADSSAGTRPVPPGNATILSRRA